MISCTFTGKELNYIQQYTLHVVWLFIVCSAIHPLFLCIIKKLFIAEISRLGIYWCGKYLYYISSCILVNLYIMFLSIITITCSLYLSFYCIIIVYLLATSYGEIKYIYNVIFPASKLRTSKCRYSSHSRSVNFLANWRRRTGLFACSLPRTLSLSNAPIKT